MKTTVIKTNDDFFLLGGGINFILLSNFHYCFSPFCPHSQFSYCRRYFSNFTSAPPRQASHGLAPNVLANTLISSSCQPQFTQRVILPKRTTFILAFKLFKGKLQHHFMDFFCARGAPIPSKAYFNLLKKISKSPPRYPLLFDLST